MASPEETLSRREDYVKEIIFLLSSLSYARTLVSLLNHAKSQGKRTGMRVSCASPPVSHLLFADDSLFLCKAKLRECDEVMKEVKVYWKASGQCIIEKSSLLFGKRVRGTIKQEIKITLGIDNEGGMGTYLGSLKT